jgi:MFS family permease
MQRDDSARSVAADAHPPVERRQLVRAVIASTIGTSIEWYDFFLYGTMSALVFPKVFFPHDNFYTGVMESFGTYFIGFIARPVGGAIFGHFGDRIGRKATLIITLLLMGIGTFLVGCLPGYQVLGKGGAVAALLILRTAQGLGVGGEWGGSVVLSMEWGHDKPRGFITSWPQFGVAVGLLLANAAVLAMSALAGPAFITWGWRVPFLASIVLVLVGLYIRLGILETPVFSRLIQENRVERAPLLEVLKRNPREIVLSALARMPEQAPFYIFTSFVLSYGVKSLHQEKNFLLLAVMVAAALEFLTLPFFGYLSDRFGRKNVYLAGVIGTAIIAIPYIYLLNTMVPAIIFLTIALSLVAHDAEYGPQAALIAEQFTGRLRYSGASVGYQLASVVAGGPAPLIAVWLLSTTKNPYTIAYYIIGCAVVGFLAVLGLRDRSKVDISAEYDDVAEPEGYRRPALG